jgi:hypothetical protein
MKPGKHQIIVYDRKLNQFWVKNIMVEMRACEVKQATLKHQDPGSIDFITDNDGTIHTNLD